jgi:glycine cleavage system H lipoate-binding protein
MERRTEEEGTYRVLPDRARPCVWMVAGFLSYRLCDRDFDCENCPLDAAIRGSPPIQSPAAAQSTGAPPAWEIRDGLHYHPVYGWVANSAEGSLRWGLDGLIARLLDRVSAVVLPAVGTNLVRGQVACWVMDDGELVPLRSPVSGGVVRTNGAVQRDPTLVTRAPYDQGWLVEVNAPDGVAAQPGLGGAEKRRAEAEKQMARIYRVAMGYLHIDQAVGPTQQDGGERLTDLRRMLGRSRYHRLVMSVLR